MRTTTLPRSDASESLPVRSRRDEVEVRRGGPLALGELVGDALVLVGDLPDEQREQPATTRDGSACEAELQPRGAHANYAGTM